MDEKTGALTVPPPREPCIWPILFRESKIQQISEEKMICLEENIKVSLDYSLIFYFNG